MTNPTRRDDGPLVEIWIEDTAEGQALFVTTTTSDGNEATAALWQPDPNQPDPRTDEP